jgi:hypothetical protein
VGQGRQIADGDHFHVAAKNVAGISALIHKNGVRGWFETFGLADIEKGRAMEKDEPISMHCPEWAEPKVKEGGAVVPAKAAIFENHLKHPTMKYGLGGIVNGAGSYGWGGADGTQFVVDRSKRTFTLFMVQTQHYKAPTYPAFLALANEACGLTAPAAPMTGTPGKPGAGGMSGPFQQRDTNGDGKLYWNTGEHGAKTNHWLHLTFTGLSDAELIGAKVELTAEGRKQHRWIHTNHSYKSGGALDAHFGLGKATSAEVKVTLLNGRTQTFPSIAADRSHPLNLTIP